MVKVTYLEIIDKFNLKHNLKFKYPIFEYINNTQYIEIECPEHGLYPQQIKVHMKGFGCKKCSYIIRKNNRTKSLKDVLIDINNKHCFKYEYPLITSEYVNTNNKVSIKCHKHGIFKQSINSHMTRGCKQCALEYTADINRLTYDEIVKKSRKKHNNIYGYFKVEEILSNKNKIGIICKYHGSSKQTINNHMNGSGCRKCKKNGISKPEIELADFIKQIGHDILINKRNIIRPLELDIYIPSLKKAIEFNGMYWHYNHTNPNCKPKGYHAQKSNLCREKDIKLLHIREDLWNRDKNKMKLVIQNFLDNGK